ncbi:diacylglycerol kinase family protein [Sphingobacterium oryzagri]|uniref:Diacylglycerol kinase family protein n=1 Tax=Sphingobacterium oryzagri TaxID=3025669 RepID=A0ABY7WG42_9SPHI|nr:diacylglycerol kinase family protein [Sphingobacterium sp. KACC 22765]WDF67467.1 diacylglycerol kinase family protein [Sphingobacterium sp. KACC 22765]
MNINARLASFSFALDGIVTLFKEEANAKIHLTCAILVIIAGFLLQVSTAEWMVLIFAMAFVIALELVNTALEKLCDLVHPEKHNQIKKIKDMAAGAVLLAAIAAALLACFIFLPKMWLLVSE